MTSWGFLSKKEQEVTPTTTSTAETGESQLSPFKNRSRKIMGGRRRSEYEQHLANNNNNNNNNSNNSSTSSGKKKPLSFGRNFRQQKQKQSSPYNNNYTSAQEESDKHQAIQLDASDDGIELMYGEDHFKQHHHSSATHNTTTTTDNNNNNNNNQQHHHSRRSMSNHKGQRRSIPVSPKPAQHENFDLPFTNAAPGTTTASATSTSLTQRLVNTAHVPVISLEKDVLVQRTKIFRAQFSVLFPVSATTTDATTMTFSTNNALGAPRHRIPLGGTRPVQLSYRETLQLLQNANPGDEMTCVKVELHRTKVEMDVLEQDKDALKRRWRSLQQQQQQQQQSSSNNQHTINPLQKQQQEQQQQQLSASSVDWDIHRLLHSQRKMGLQERLDLEQIRGRCITVHLSNPRAEDAFLNKCCGAKQHLTPDSNTEGPLSSLTMYTMTPQNCRAGGAGATIRHLALLPRGSSFFVSRDNGKSYSWGQLPPRILQRMKTQGLDPVTHCGGLKYLSTGPNGSYFAEFRSGECWWGCAGEGKEFYEILQQWDVYRVVFGASMMHTTTTSGGGHDNNIITNSWIILAKDGRAAWKNVPSRLHQILESRLANAAAPAEVSLGSGESYYVRFLDGTVDYCLPAEIAAVCERIQSHGGTITDIAMNPEVSHEFMIRHTEVPTHR